MGYLEKFNRLPDDLKSFFSSDDPRWETEKACFLYGLGEEDIASVTNPIGLIYVNDLSLADLPQKITGAINKGSGTIYGLSYEINKRIFSRFPDFYKDSSRLLEEWSKLKAEPVISEEEARKKLIELEPWILENEKEERLKKDREEEEKRKYQASLIKSTLDQALRDYPELGEQLVTSRLIKLKNFPEPVRPSIKNWITDYAMNLGYGKHSAVDQSNYLFQSANARSLNPKERQRLTYVLKALDDKTPVTINKDSRQLIFPDFKEEAPQPISRPIAAQKIASQAEPKRPTARPEEKVREESGNFRFSYPQKMPYEGQPKPKSGNAPVPNGNVVDLRNKQQ